MQKYEYSILGSLERLWAHISRRRKVQFTFLVVLMLFTAFAEIFSIGALLPFLAVISDPQSFFENPTIQPVLAVLDITSPEAMLLPFTLVFSGAALIAGAMRLLQAWANMRVSFATGADLSIAVYRSTLYQPYAVHVSRNSSTIINAVSSKTIGAVQDGIIPVITILTSMIILLSIMSTLVMINPVVALSAFAGFGFTYGLIILLTRQRLSGNGTLIARESNLVIKSLQEGLGGIRDVLIDGSQEVYCRVHGRAVTLLNRAHSNNQFIGQSPRFGIEAIGMVLIAALAYWLVEQPGGFAKAVPVLGTLAFGAQRMLPALQQIYGCWTTLQGNVASLSDVIELLEQPIHEQQVSSGKALPFREAIELRKLHFFYNQGGPEVLQNINLAITKGSKVGFIGRTGSGKSTMLDIVMGLLQPTSGNLLVDGTAIDKHTCRAWQRNIAHVPQSIFLSDTSIEENIAFGLPPEKIDYERVKWSARQAQIEETIESWPMQYKTFVGERGIRLSGGQRQRIGIARALYKQANLIIFDEATSALDSETEEAVMQAIERSQENLTVLIIAHRVTTLRSCDMIVELDNGEIIATGSYEQMISNRNVSIQPESMKSLTSC